MDHRHLRLLAAGAALEDLDPAERVMFEAHATTCPTCRSLARDLGETLAELACSLPTAAPPAMLLGRIVASLRPDPARGGVAHRGPV